MLKKTLTYKDYNGKPVTEVYYFHLDQAEIVEIEVAEKGGLIETLKEIISTEDREHLVKLFKKIILMSYGRKSEDGRTFEKDPSITKAFVNTGAYSALFMELITEAESGSEFVKGIMPADMPQENPNEIKIAETPTPSPVIDANRQVQDLSTMSKDELLAMLTQKSK